MGVADSPTDEDLLPELIEVLARVAAPRRPAIIQAALLRLTAAPVRALRGRPTRRPRGRAGPGSGRPR